MAEYFFSYSDQGFFSEGYYIPQKSAVISQNLPIYQGIGTSINYVNQKDFLILTETISYHFSLANIGFVDTLDLTQLAAPTTEARVEQLLEFTEDIFRFGYDEDIIDTLDFAETIIPQHPLIVRTISDYLDLQQYPNSLLGDQTIVPLDPNVGNGPLPTHQHPGNCDVTSLPTISLGALNIRSPIFGNKDSYHRERINTHNRGNELIIFGPTYWPKDATTELQFDTLTIEQAKALSTFVDTNLGKMVTIVDHEGNSFTGMIITPDISYSQAGRGCNYKSSFSFQRFF